ncbi:hypothetical protein N865_12805 [Intrasporangium oryzae NRRL B-24470]|uniref:DUF4352 domain-containing protein n=1 Tax=Intrasporangium oryzae NRRL B-24470 TaxID=1386089 RepID=W9G7C5_9MICO|nr:hypothetical protein [Intrasporangium oryzae]EWT01935.1 hypothetical protein N865_12805 [Intrasporangium oryzae NRRL B-24470]
MSDRSGDGNGAGGHAMLNAVIGVVGAVLAAVAGVVATSVLSGRSDQPTSPNAFVGPTTSSRQVGTTPFAGHREFQHFTVQVNELKGPRTDGSGSLIYDLMVRVCVTSAAPDAEDGRTRISWDPWTLVLEDGRKIRPDAGLAGLVGALPRQKYYNTGECGAGAIHFRVGDPAVPVSGVRYANVQGDVATFER